MKGQVLARVVVGEQLRAGHACRHQMLAQTACPILAVGHVDNRSAGIGVLAHRQQQRHQLRLDTEATRLPRLRRLDPPARVQRTIEK